MINEVFNDLFAQRENILTKIDARVKIIFVLLSLVVVITSGKFYCGLFIFCLLVSVLLFLRIPVKIIAFRLASPLFIGMILLGISICTKGTTVLFKWQLFSGQLIGYQEGLVSGTLIISKILGAVSLVIFLSMTTPIDKLLKAACWLRFPRTFVEIALLSYRYIFVLLNDAITVWNAQTIRLGYMSFKIGLQSMGKLAGAVLIRAYDQSVAIYQSMLLRGYNEESCPNVSFAAFKRTDLCAFYIFGLVFISLLIIRIYL